MIDFIPYFAGLITLLFGLGFRYAVVGPDKKSTKKK